MLLELCIAFKGQKKSKIFFQADFPPKKLMIKFYFTTMKPQIDLFSFVFWKKLKTSKRNFELTLEGVK